MSSAFEIERRVAGVVVPYVRTIFTSPARTVAKYCNAHVCVCVSVCLSTRISSKSHARSLPILVHVARGRGSVLLRRRCDMLCTSGFMDAIMFLLYNGPYSGMNFATNDRFRLNLLIYRNVGQNSISYY